MRILHITPQAPSDKGGGDLGIAQTLLSICDGNVVDYVGPKIEDMKYAALYNERHYLEPSHNLPLRIVDTLQGNTNSRYRAWLSFAKYCNFSQYDAVVLDFTKLDYCLPYLARNKVIVRVHNVEYDFAMRWHRSEKSLESLITSRLTGKRERRVLERADVLVVLTEEDRKRLLEIYGRGLEDRMTIIPVCIASAGTSPARADNGGVLQLLVTGSLWFGANYQGVMWLMQQVLPRLNIDYRLQVAGSHPADVLKDAVAQNDKVELADTPETIRPFFERADVVLIPVFDGAGMKVKVAEAMAYGKPVVATPHALIGYECDDCAGVVRAADAQGFADAIDVIGSLPQTRRLQLEEEVRGLFNKGYSMETSKALWADILRSCTETDHA